MKADERSGLVRDACFKKWRDKGGDFAESRSGKFLVYDRRPDYVLDKEGLVVGVDAWVRLYGQNGIEIPIDPHRRIINPPTIHQGEDDPLGAFMDTIWNSVLETPNPKGWKTKGTVDTFFPSLDGFAQCTSNTYSSAREGTGTTVASTSSTFGSIGQYFSSPTYQVYETFLAFDTSAIADTDDVSAVDLALYLITDGSTTDFTSEVREKDWGSTLDGSDFVAGSQLGNYTLLASINTSGIGATSSYKTYTSTAAFLTTTNIKTGTVRFFVSSSRHRLNNTPTGDEYLDSSTRSASGTTQDPKLTITHAAPVLFEGWGYPI